MFCVWCCQESRLNVDALSKRDVLLLFSVLEGELEARDLVIQALRVSECSIFSAAPGRTQQPLILLQTVVGSRPRQSELVVRLGVLHSRRVIYVFKAPVRND